MSQQENPLAKAIAHEVPDGVQLRVVEDSDTLKHLVIPAALGEATSMRRTSNGLPAGRGSALTRYSPEAGPPSDPAGEQAGNPYYG